MEADIVLDKEEEKKIVELLKRTKFDDFEVHRHYSNDDGKPRHGVPLSEAKEIYYKFDKIVAISKRKGIHGFKYDVIYKISKKLSYELLFLLDEKPMKLFNAWKSFNDIERKVMRKYLGI